MKFFNFLTTFVSAIQAIVNFVKKKNEKLVSIFLGAKDIPREDALNCQTELLDANILLVIEMVGRQQIGKLLNEGFVICGRLGHHIVVLKLAHKILDQRLHAKNTLQSRIDKARVIIINKPVY